MFNRTWLSTIALGLTLCALALHAQEARHPALESDPIPAPRQDESAATREHDTDPKQYGPAQLLPAIQGIETAIRDMIASEDTTERQRQDDRDKRDLQAQEEMAFSAKAMFWAALASILLTALGMIMIWRTLLYTRAAAGSARDTLRAARAWILVENHDTFFIENGIYYEDIQDPSQSVNYGVGVAISFRWKNFGQSPALKAKYYTCAIVVDDPFEVPKFLSNCISKDNLHESICAHGASGTTPIKVIYDDNLERLERREVGFYIYSTVEYYDVFQPEILRKSELCAKIECNGSIQDKESGSLRKNYIVTFIGPQNTAT